MSVVYETIIPALIRDEDQSIEKAVMETAFALETDIKTSMTGGKSGRRYPDQPARSSAPGEAPAVQTGVYINSIQTTQIDKRSAEVGTNSEIAPYLEFGTAHMAKRPHFTPAVHKLERQMERQAADSLRPVFERHSVE